MPRIVVLGVGTGVGKTYVTAALAKALGATGERFCALKPVETGVPSGDRAADAQLLESASNHDSPEPHPLYVFRDPVSPHLASRRARKPISLVKINRWVRSLDKPKRGNALWILVETAGGVFSPLTATKSNLDLARQLSPAIWVLVARDGLGMLHDVRSTLLAMRAFGRVPDFVILSQAPPRDASTRTNAHELSRLGVVRPIATVTRAAHPERHLRKLVVALRAYAA